MDLTREYFDSKVDGIMMRMDGLATTEALNSVQQDISGLRIEMTSFSPELADIRKSLAILAQRESG